MSKVQAWLQENKHKYTDRTQWIKDCAKQLDVRIDTIYNYTLPIWPQGDKSLQKNKPMTRAEFMAKHDTATKTRLAIRKGVGTIFEAEDPTQDAILEDAEFRVDRCIGANAMVYRRVADEPEFRTYQFRQGDKIFWTTPRTQKWAIEEVSRAREL